MKEFISTLIAVPLVIVLSIVGLWFGIRSVNDHFDRQKVEQAEQLDLDRRNKWAEVDSRLAVSRCLQKVADKAKGFELVTPDMCAKATYTAP